MLFNEMSEEEKDTLSYSMLLTLMKLYSKQESLKIVFGIENQLTKNINKYDTSKYSLSDVHKLVENRK